MKRILSLFLVLVMLVCMIPTAFATLEEKALAARELYALGLFKGTGTDSYGNPVFDLDRAPTRHEAVTMLVRLLGKEEEALAGKWNVPFTDVADWAKPYVGYAYANGLTTGTSATKYSGNSLVTVSQYLTFVLRALGYDSQKDFVWNRAWELSDKIGLTNKEYNSKYVMFTRGDVAQISKTALTVNLKGTVVPLNKLLEDQKSADSRTWYYVDELGCLQLKTTISSGSSKSYWIYAEFKYKDGSRFFDTQSSSTPLVQYDLTSIFSNSKRGAIIDNALFYVFSDAASKDSFWADYEKTGDFTKTLNKFSDRLLARFSVDSDIRIEYANDDTKLTSLVINRNESTKQESYVAKISPKILTTGAYGLVCKRAGTEGNKMCALNRSNGDLTFTKEIDFFAEPGATGTFQVAHSCFSINKNDEIICTLTKSASLTYNF